MEKTWVWYVIVKVPITVGPILYAYERAEPYHETAHTLESVPMRDAILQARVLRLQYARALVRSVNKAKRKSEIINVHTPTIYRPMHACTSFVTTRRFRPTASES